MMCILLVICMYIVPKCAVSAPLRFNNNGEFKILQVADMHYANGKATECLDVLPTQAKWCTDLNTTAFLERAIVNEKPDFIVFTGDNIFGYDTKYPMKSMDEAFGPAVRSKIPWAAVLGNHDQESRLTREEIMKYITTMENTLSQVNPHKGYENIDGFGNYNLEVHGPPGSRFQDKSVLNLYFLDSGDYTTIPNTGEYAWIKTSQQVWFKETSARLKRAYMAKPERQSSSAPGLAFFHIPLPEYAKLNNVFGENLEGQISSGKLNSGFFTTMVEAGDVKGVFVGHDHKNDFCGELNDIHCCYAGGFGYHAYGLTGWPRRTRVITSTLEKLPDGGWGTVQSIKTWKRLDDPNISLIQTLSIWPKE